MGRTSDRGQRAVGCKRLRKHHNTLIADLVVTEAELCHRTASRQETFVGKAHSHHIQPTHGLFVVTTHCAVRSRHKSPYGWPQAPSQAPLCPYRRYDCRRARAATAKKQAEGSETPLTRTSPAQPLRGLHCRVRSRRASSFGWPQAPLQVPQRPHRRSGYGREKAAKSRGIARR